MELDIHGKQINVGDTLRAHVEDKLGEIDQKYFNHATNATVTFTKEGHGHGLIKVTISYLVSKGIMINTEAEAGDAYGAFDAAAEKAAKRLRRNKKKLRDHHERGTKTVEAEIIKARNYTLAVEGEEAEEQDNSDDVPQGDDPIVIAEMAATIETITVSGAVMRLDLSGENALLFRNAQTQELNMIYRRSDGNIGWVDPASEQKKTKAA
ncbi:MAG: ribosomal subunit interface protein [Micavibrio sp.]|nr:ribosomal subunit interface protein [Micavibrio sp.]|tara:strand:- start:469 stop:1095 length:627 start_codon:yes stop_codon:yes gene_type:complete